MSLIAAPCSPSDHKKAGSLHISGKKQFSAENVYDCSTWDTSHASFIADCEHSGSG